MPVSWANSSFSRIGPAGSAPESKTAAQQYKFNVHATFKPSEPAQEASICSKLPQSVDTCSELGHFQASAEPLPWRSVHSATRASVKPLFEQLKGLNTASKSSLCTQWAADASYSVEISDIPESHSALVFELARKSGPFNSKKQFNICRQSLVFDFCDCRDSEKFYKSIRANPWLDGIKCEQICSPTRDALVVKLDSASLRCIFRNSSTQYELFNILSKFGEVSFYCIDTSSTPQIVCTFYDVRSVNRAVSQPFEFQTLLLDPQIEKISQDYFAHARNNKGSLNLTMMDQPSDSLWSRSTTPGSSLRSDSSLSIVPKSSKLQNQQQQHSVNSTGQANLFSELLPFSQQLSSFYQRDILKDNGTSKTDSISSVDSLSSSSSLGTLETCKLFQEASYFKSKFQKYSSNRTSLSPVTDDKRSEALACTSVDLAPPVAAPLKSFDTMVNLTAIEQGKEDRCTMMVRNIPNKLGFDEFKKFIDETSYGKYNFLYLRFDFSNHCNVGYAFVSFTNPLYVKEFVELRDGMDWKQYHHNSDKVIEIRFAKIQGYDNLIQKFRKSPVMDQERSWRPRFYYTDGPKAGMEAEYIT